MACYILDIGMILYSLLLLSARTFTNFQDEIHQKWIFYDLAEVYFTQIYEKGRIRTWNLSVSVVVP